MKKIKVLFLQPKSYFDDILYTGYLENISATFGLVFTTNLHAKLSSYDLVVSCIDHDLISRKICLKAKNIGVATLYFLDGLYCPVNAVEAWVFRKKNISQFDSDCYDFIFGPNPESMGTLNTTSANYFYIPKRVSYEVKNIASNKDVLITTANTPYFNRDELRFLTESIFKIIKVLDDKGVNYKLRVFDMVLFNGICDRLGYSPKNYIDCDFEKYASTGRYLFTTFSSVAIPFRAQGGITVEINHRNNPDNRAIFSSSIRSDFENSEIDTILVSKKPDSLVVINKLEKVDFNLFVNNMKKSGVSNGNEVYISASYIYRFLYRALRLQRYKLFLINFLKKIGYV